MQSLLFYICCVFAVVQLKSVESGNAANTILESVRESGEPASISNPAASPPDISTEQDEETEHIYYNMTIYSDRSGLMAEYYVDLLEWMKEAGVKNDRNRPLLVRSFRKAAGAPIGFSFPFYGHLIQNLTIATGGFCYVGDQTHSWLASTQYIAPLMANFDTLDYSASIQYASDLKSKMVISWNNVSLHDNRDAGFFNFQAHLHANGDIYFVYKDVPVEVQKISDFNHPRKVGISDSYLFSKKVTTDGASQSIKIKRVIHEYHRISVPIEKITSNSVVILNALPTCLQFTDCKSCSNSKLKTFDCSWCSPKNSSAAGFCSEQAGFRRRQQDGYFYFECDREFLQDKKCSE